MLEKGAVYISQTKRFICIKDIKGTHQSHKIAIAIYAFIYLLRKQNNLLFYEYNLAIMICNIIVLNTLQYYKVQILKFELSNSKFDIYFPFCKILFKYT